MDVHAWLQDTEYRHPPESTPLQRNLHSSPTGHRHRRHHAADLHNLKRQRSSSSYIHPLQHCRRPSTEISQAPSSVLSIEQRSLEDEEQLYDGQVDPYKRRPRRKTRPDRYEYKPHSRLKRNQNRAKRSRKHDEQDLTSYIDKSAERIRNALALKGRTSKRRLTLRAADNFGLFRHGKVSAQSTDRRGLPDLTFNDLTFLRKRPNADMSAEATLETARHPQHLRPEEENISSYFARPLLPPLRRSIDHHDHTRRSDQPRVSQQHLSFGVDESPTGLTHREQISDNNSQHMTAFPEEASSADDRKADDEMLDLVIGSKRFHQQSSPAMPYKTTDMLDILSSMRHQTSESPHAESPIASNMSPQRFVHISSRMSETRPRDTLAASRSTSRCNRSTGFHSISHEQEQAKCRSNRDQLPVRDLQRFTKPISSAEPRVSASSFTLWRSAACPPDLTGPHFHLGQYKQPRMPVYQREHDSQPSSIVSCSRDSQEADACTEFSTDCFWQQLRHDTAVGSFQSRSSTGMGFKHDDHELATSQHQPYQNFWQPNPLY